MKPAINLLSLLGASTFLAIPAAWSVEIIPIESFDPNTFFEGGVTAGIDFDDGTSANHPEPTQPGFLSIPASNEKSYNVTTNGITFDLQIRNANLGNQNRNRNNLNAGTLINDFEQWYGRHPDSGVEVEGTTTLSGLTPNTEYQISFFTANVGAGQTSTRFYDGATIEAPLIIEFRTSGNQNNYAAWSPGITLQMTSSASGEIVVTLQAVEYVAGENFESRLGICGISVISLGPPPVTNDLAITSIALDQTTDEVTLTFSGDASTTYSCFSSTDLVDFSTPESPVGGSLTTDETGVGTVVLSSTEAAKFYRIEPVTGP